jgi:hypothetical protein
MNLENAFNAEDAEKMPRSKSLWDLENAKNSEKKVTHPKGEQRISLCALCVSAISALKEVLTAVLRMNPRFLHGKG